MDKFKVSPKLGFLVRDPITGEELTQATEVPRSSFWLRRIDRKEVDLVPDRQRPQKSLQSDEGSK